MKLLIIFKYQVKQNIKSNKKNKIKLNYTKCFIIKDNSIIIIISKTLKIYKNALMNPSYKFIN